MFIVLWWTMIGGGQTLTIVGGLKDFWTPSPFFNSTTPYNNYFTNLQQKIIGTVHTACFNLLLFPNSGFVRSIESDQVKLNCACNIKMNYASVVILPIQLYYKQYTKGYSRGKKRGGGQRLELFLTLPPKLK